MFTFNQLDGLLNSIQKDNDMFNSTSKLSFSPTFSQYYIDETPERFNKVVINVMGDNP